ncbi:SRPBCC domain-containing protein [Micromonospora mangrovi]|uniref:SRPBCC domain-containing protein n=2 Tax=Micromonospora TaxID=1873 RepID=A0AAU7MCW1_9ACTN
MADILHRVGVEHSSPERVYAALTTVDGLSGWWTEQTSGVAEVGGVLEFRFAAGGFDMKVVELVAGRRVCWEVVDGPPEWVGTVVRWELRQEGDFTIVVFAHEGWREPVEFMYHCSTKWAVFLLSLKRFLETGVGAPDPRDVRISDWH